MDTLLGWAVVAVLVLAGAYLLVRIIAAAWFDGKLNYMKRMTNGAEQNQDQEQQNG